MRLYTQMKRQHPLDVSAAIKAIKAAECSINYRETGTGAMGKSIIEMACEVYSPEIAEALLVHSGERIQMRPVDSYAVQYSALGYAIRRPKAKFARVLPLILSRSDLVFAGDGCASLLENAIEAHLPDIAILMIRDYGMHVGVRGLYNLVAKMTKFPWSDAVGQALFAAGYRDTAASGHLHYMSSAIECALSHHANHIVDLIAPFCDLGHPLPTLATYASPMTVLTIAARRGPKWFVSCILQGRDRPSSANGWIARAVLAFVYSTRDNPLLLAMQEPIVAHRERLVQLLLRWGQPPHPSCPASLARWRPSRHREYYSFEVDRVVRALMIVVVLTRGTPRYVPTELMETIIDLLPWRDDARYWALTYSVRQ